MKIENLVRNFKGLFGRYDIGYEYYIRLDEIKIKPEFLRTPPGNIKMMQKWNYYRRTGKLQSKIILNRNFELVDGYTSYCIAERECINRVPVWFVD